MNDRKREVEEKAKQLEQVASLSALIAGFALVAMVEVNIPSTLHHHTPRPIRAQTLSYLIPTVSYHIASTRYISTVVMMWGGVMHGGMDIHTSLLALPGIITATTRAQ